MEILKLHIRDGVKILNNKIKLVALIGQSGSGKDTILNWMVSHSPIRLNRIIPYTSRPPRPGETDGIDYIFKDEKFFTYAHDLIALSNFNDWEYAFSLESFDKNIINIGIFNPKAIYDIMSSTFTRSLFDLRIILIKANDKERLIRQLMREKNPNCDEIVRRYMADKEDFRNIDFKLDLSIENSNNFEIAYNAAPLVHYLIAFNDDSDKIR